MLSEKETQDVEILMNSLFETLVASTKTKDLKEMKLKLKHSISIIDILTKYEIKSKRRNKWQNIKMGLKEIYIKLKSKLER